MDCRSCEKHINDYLDGELSNQQEKKLENHLIACKSCKKVLEEYRRMWDQLGALEGFSPEEGFEGKVLSKLKPYGAGEVRESHSAPSQTAGGKKSLRTQRQSNGNLRRNPVKDGILITAYFLTLFVVLSVLRNQVFQNVEWISGILVTIRVFRDVFDGMIFRGLFTVMVVYPIRMFHWARVNFTELSIEARVLYSVVLLNLVLMGTFSQLLLQKMSGKRRKEKGGDKDEVQQSES